MSRLLTIEEAAGCDFVFAEFVIRKNGTVITPASVVMTEYGDYLIECIGNTLRFKGETYGFRWRCWEMMEPTKEERVNMPWQEVS